MILSWREWRSQGGRRDICTAFWGCKLMLKCHVTYTKCQRMLVITIHKMSNASRWCLVAKSYQDHQVLQREQLPVQKLETVKGPLVSPATSAGMLFNSRLRHNAFRYPGLRTFPLRSHSIVA